MDGAEFRRLSQDIYERVLKAFETIDPDEAEAVFNQDNVTITFADNTRFVLNRQPPVSQIWLATKNRGLHFSYQTDTQTWVAAKSGEELFATLEKEVSQRLGYTVHI